MNILLKKGELLDNKGELNQEGFSFEPIIEYRKSAVNAPLNKLKEWDYYQIYNEHYALILSVSDLSTKGIFKVSYYNFDDLEIINKEYYINNPYGIICMPTTSKYQDIKYEKSNFSFEFISDINERKLIVKIVDEINKESGFNFQIAFDEPKVFLGNKPHYGSFQNVNNYFILVGKRGKNELIGYYGEKLVLECMNIGINTCWVAQTYKHFSLKCKISDGEQFYVLIAFGYGKSNGVKHKDKNINTLSNVNENSPKWFKDGLYYAMMAPTAMNQQKFYLELIDENKVNLRRRFGFYSLMDLGIVRYHFELGAGKSNFTWVNKNEH